jgi:hypothetical protein
MKVPVLLIQSTVVDEHRNRSSIKQGWMTEVKSDVKTVQIERIYDIGHAVQTDAPGALNKLIGKFATQVA